MLEGGEDVRFLARRLVILASEDIGNADPHALAAGRRRDAGLRIRRPARVPAHAGSSRHVSGLRTEIKRRDRRHRRSRHDIREGRLLPVPRHLQDSHYAGAKRLGHGKGYEYAHNAPDGVAAQDYLGVEREYYRPTDRGFELAARRTLGGNPPASSVRKIYVASTLRDPKLCRTFCRSTPAFELLPFAARSSARVPNPLSCDPRESHRLVSFVTEDDRWLRFDPCSRSPC